MSFNELLEQHCFSLVKYEFSDAAIKEELISLLEQRELNFVPISISSGWEKYDQEIFKVLTPLLTQYREKFDCLNIQKDNGYYLCQVNSDQTDHNDASKVLTETVEKSCFPVVALLFLNTPGYATISFPKTNIRIRVNENYCLFFPANWLNKPIVNTDNSKLSFVCTFFSES